MQLTGYVPDVRPYVQGAKCYIVPLRVGGGTRLKILDAWAMGKAVVSTSIGCEGLDARDGVNILIRDTAEGFAEAVLQVLQDARLRESLGFAARDTAEGAFDQGNALVMLGQYDDALKRYDRALALRPGWAAALNNREIARIRGERKKTQGGETGNTDDKPDES